MKNHLENLSKKIFQNFKEKEEKREKALSLHREVIKLSSFCIRFAHREEFEKAETFLSEAKKSLLEIKKDLENHPDIYYAGFLFNAEKEFAEASITLALLKGDLLPEPDEIQVEYSSYLNGLGEATGELRRYILDNLRKGEDKRCEEFLNLMDDIYYFLISMDFSEAITGGLRKTSDMVRIIIEKTRGELTSFYQQKELGKKLEDFIPKKLG